MAQEVKITLRADDKATAALDSFQQKFNRWMKENKHEQRQFNAVFNETKDVINGIGTGLTILGQTTSKEMKVISNSVNAGIVSFQGFYATLEAMSLGGPIGIAIAGIGALVLAFMSLTNSVDEATTKAIDKFIERVVETGNIDAKIKKSEAQVKKLKGDIEKNIEWISTLDPTTGTAIMTPLAIDAALEKRLKRSLGIFEGVTEKLKTAKGEGDALKEVFGLLGESVDKVKPIVEGSSAALAENIKKLEEQRAKLVLGTEAWADLAVKIGRAKKEQEMYNQLDKLFEEGFTKIGPYTPKKKPGEKEEKKHPADITMRVQEMGKLQMKQEELAVGFGDMFNKIWKDTGGWTTGMLSGLEAVHNGIMDGIGKGFEEVFGEANSLLEMFIQNFLTQLTSQAVQGAIGGLIGMVTGGVGDLFISLFGMHTGGIVPKAHGGMYVNAPSTREFPIIVRGGETIRTEDQEKQLKGNFGRPTNVIMNFNSPVTAPAWVVQNIKKYLNETGMDVSKVLVKTTGRV